MNNASLVSLVLVSSLLQGACAAPSSAKLRDTRWTSGHHFSAPELRSDEESRSTAGSPTAQKPLGLFNGLSEFARRLSSGLENVGSEISNVINDNVKSVSDAVSTALQTGGHIANSGVQLAVGIQKIPLSFLSGV